jgi:hypothetical protein
LATPGERTSEDANPGERILKKYGYPPDLADQAVQTVLAQAEVYLGNLVVTPAQVATRDGMPA